MSKKITDLTGRQFGQWEVLRFAERKSNKTYWECKCDCGTTKNILSTSLVSGKSKSCGCSKKGSGNGRYIDGRFKDKLYHIYHGILKRCNNPNEIAYKNYGGRGIACEWKIFDDFREDMKEEFLNHQKKHGVKNTTIERINNNGNYCKENCKFITRQEQNMNRRSCHFITYKNETMTITEWSKKLNIPRGNLYYRINKGWSIKKAFNKLNK